MSVAEFDAILALANPIAIRNKLAECDDDFKQAYHKYNRNLRYHRCKLNRIAKEPETVAKTPIDFTTNMNTGAVRKNAPARVKKALLKIGLIDCIEPLTEGTIKNRLSVVSLIYQYKYNKPIPSNHHIIRYINNEKYNTTQIYKDFSFIIDDVVSVAQHLNTSTKVLYSVFCNFNIGQLSKIRLALYPYFLKVKTDYQAKRGAKATTKCLSVDISFERPDIVENAQKIDNIHLKLMYYIVMLLPPPRIGQLAELRLAKNEADIMNKSFNWFWNDTLYWNKTKTNTAYKYPDNTNPDLPDDDDMPVEITELIAQLPEDTDYLMGAYANANISHTFVRVLYNIYKKKITCNDIRHIFCSKSILGKNLQRITKDALNVNHKLNEHLCYIVED